jgi:hypothetical protein
MIDILSIIWRCLSPSVEAQDEDSDHRILQESCRKVTVSRRKASEMHWIPPVPAVRLSPGCSSNFGSKFVAHWLDHLPDLLGNCHKGIPMPLAVF